MANRLSKEQSPYLLQHAHNPVDWYPWGDEAFEKAERENKPVLVSIGYAACHWCHVMERESFEDEATAAYMNEHYINIKVDREEHPDVDQMYMDAVQAITQSGGWPLNVFVTPGRMPFYGGTYFPPKPLYGRASWMQVLQQINNVWQTQQDEVKTQTKQMHGYLHQISQVARGSGVSWSAESCRKVADNMLANADRDYGGFGTAPKFPAATSVLFLLEHYQYTGYEPALRHATASLDAMARGGIYDHLGGGFARYSTDAKWLAPHFEKMLYDNALLVIIYAKAYHITQSVLYKKVVEETVSFINRELKSEEGGFYCALDADSEGVEGKFYTWTWEDWTVMTGGDTLAEQYFGIVEDGNWEHTNILHEAKDIAMVADENNVQPDEARAHIDKLRKQLFKKRKKRVRPATDDKCLLSWNALMNCALVTAGELLDNDDYIRQAKQHVVWMVDTFEDDGAYMHTYKNGKAKITAKADDLAYLVAAMLQLGSVENDHQLIVKAAAITDLMLSDFLHEDKSFFYYSSVQQKDIPVRKVDLYDGATPSANAMMAHNLIQLGMLMERTDWSEQGRYMLQTVHDNTTRYPTSFALWAVYGQRMYAGYKTVVAVGYDDEPGALKPLQKNYPHACVLSVSETGISVPVLAGKSNNGERCLYLCNTSFCSPPVSDVKTAAEMLEKITG